MGGKDDPYSTIIKVMGVASALCFGTAFAECATNNFTQEPTLICCLIGGGALFLVMCLLALKCSPNRGAAFAQGLGLATLVFSSVAAALVPLTIYNCLPTDGSSQILTQGQWTTSSVVVVATAGILFLFSAIWLYTKNHPSNCRATTAGFDSRFCRPWGFGAPFGVRRNG